MGDGYRTMLGRLAAETSWANTTNRSARNAPARAAFEAKFLEQADGDPVRAAHLRKAYYARLALKSVRARQRKNVRAAKAWRVRGAAGFKQARPTAIEQAQPLACVGRADRRGWWI